MGNGVISFRLRRSGLLDALKGVGLLGLLIVDYTQHYLYPIYPSLEGYSPIFKMLDHGVHDLVLALFELKMFGLFVLLFGVSFYYQYGRQKEKNSSFWQVYAWRLQMLAVIGLVAALFNPDGGGLIVLALLGLVLLSVRRFSRKTVLTLAIVFAAQPLTWILLFLSFFGLPFNPFRADYSEMSVRISHNALDGDWSTYFVNNLLFGVQSNIYVLLTNGIYSIVIAVLLFGYWLGREGLLSTNEYRREWWVKSVQLSISAAIVFGFASYNLRIFADGDMILTHLSDLLKNWADMSIMMSIVSAFVLLYRSGKHPSVSSLFRTYGRMSLTNYFLQSLIGVFIFLPIGLSMAKYCGTLVSLLIAGVVFLVQIRLSRWWQTRFMRGPAEYLLHKLT